MNNLIPKSQRYLIWLGLIVCLGAWLRFYKLNQLPPGLFGDEALASLRARNAVAQHDFPIYFAAGDGGFHPAIVYLTMLARWLTGNHILAIRFGVAAAGVISLPIIFFALRAIFRLDDERDEWSTWGALLGTLVLAVMFPYILINRLGFEVMLPAPAGALVFLSLALALRTGQRRYAILAGLALGLALYTYYSARLLPVAVVLASVHLMLTTRQWRNGLIQLTLITVFASLAFIPLGLFFIKNPAMFMIRASVVTEASLGRSQLSLPLTLFNNTLRTLGGLSLPGFGDVLPRHNLSGRPVFDAFLSLLFWLGVSVLALNWRRRSAGLLAAWAGAMFLPVILTLANNSPHFTRLTGAMPALAGICALGGLQLFNVIARRNVALARLTLAFGLLFSLAVSSYDYFVRWANDPYLFDAFQIGDWQAANLARERASTDQVYLSPELLTNPAHATFDLMLKGSPVRSFPGPGCLVYFDRLPRPVSYIVDVLNDRETTGKLDLLFPTGHREQLIWHQPEPWPLYEVFKVPAGAPATAPPQPASAVFGDTIRLIGYSLNPALPKRGDSLTVTLYWQAEAPPAADYTAFIHLYPPSQEDRAPAAQSDSPPCNGTYPSSRWISNETIVDQHTLTVPADFSGETAALVVGMYSWPSLEHLRLTQSTASLSDDRYHLTDLSLQP